MEEAIKKQDVVSGAEPKVKEAQGPVSPEARRKELEKKREDLEKGLRDEQERLRKEHHLAQVRKGLFVRNHFHCMGCGGVMFERGDGRCPRCKGTEDDFPGVVVIR